jgi:hypothetical protein
VGATPQIANWLVKLGMSEYARCLLNIALISRYFPSPQLSPVIHVDANEHGSRSVECFAQRRGNLVRAIDLEALGAEYLCILDRSTGPKSTPEIPITTFRER